MLQNNELIRDFLLESYESLEQLGRDFVVLEQNPEDVEIVKRIFRGVHTVKGTCGSFGFTNLESLTHAQGPG